MKTSSIFYIVTPYVYLKVRNIPDRVPLLRTPGKNPDSALRSFKHLPRNGTAKGARMDIEIHPHLVRQVDRKRPIYRKYGKNEK